MKRLLSMQFAIALLLTVSLGAAQSGSSLADAAMRGDKAAVGDADQAGRRCRRGAGRRHDRAALGRRARRRRNGGAAGLCRRQRVGRDAHRPLHAAPPRRQVGQCGSGQGADQGRRRRQREVESERRDADAPGGADRQRRDDQPAGGRQGRHQRARSGMGTDAADFRGVGEPRRGDHGAAEARRRCERVEQDHRRDEAERARSRRRRSPAQGD